MADKPVKEVVAVDAALDALVSPTSSDVYEAVDPFSDQAVAAAAARRALSPGGSVALDDLTDVNTAGGSTGDVLTQKLDGSFDLETPSGGSQPVGPITVTADDVPNDGDTVELYTPADGALIADILISAQDWDQGAQADLYDGDPDTGMLLGAGATGALIDFNSNTSTTDDFGARGFVSVASLTGGASEDNFPYRSTGEPITLKMTYATLTGGITGVNQGTKTFTSDSFLEQLAPGATLTVSGSTGNDGTYTVASVSGFTVTVVEAIPNATGDGSLSSPLVPTTGETQFIIDDRGVPAAP